MRYKIKTNMVSERVKCGLFSHTFISISEVCTAPKNRGGGGAEADVNYNSVAERPHRLKPFQAAARAHRRATARRPPYGIWRNFFLFFFRGLLHYYYLIFR